MSDADCMRIAIEEAKKSLVLGCLPAGVVLVKDGEVIVAAHKAEGIELPHLDHAETIAIRKYLSLGENWLSGITVFSTWEPCTMCFGTILNLRAYRLVYSVEDPYGGAAKLAEIDICPRHQAGKMSVTRGFLRQEAIGLFREFLKTTKSDFWRNESKLFDSWKRD